MGIAAQMFGPQHNSGQPAPQQQPSIIQELVRKAFEKGAALGMSEAVPPDATGVQPLPGAMGANTQPGTWHPNDPFAMPPAQPANPYGTPNIQPGPTQPVAGPSAFGQELPNLVQILNALMQMDPTSGFVNGIGKGFNNMVQDGVGALTGANRTSPTNTAAREKFKTGGGVSKSDVKGKPKRRPEDDED